MGIFKHVLRMLLQRYEVIEGIDLGQRAGMEQAHKDIADLCTAEGLMKE